MNTTEDTARPAMSWIGARGGKWHKAVSPEPTFQQEEKALCGVTFTPLNVTHGEPPPTIERHLCTKCTRL